MNIIIEYTPNGQTLSTQITLADDGTRWRISSRQYNIPGIPDDHLEFYYKFNNWWIKVRGKTATYIDSQQIVRNSPMSLEYEANITLENVRLRTRYQQPASEKAANLRPPGSERSNPTVVEAPADLVKELSILCQVRNVATVLHCMESFERHIPGAISVSLAVVIANELLPALSTAPTPPLSFWVAAKALHTTQAPIFWRHDLVPDGEIPSRLGMLPQADGYYVPLIYHHKPLGVIHIQANVEDANLEDEVLGYLPQLSHIVAELMDELDQREPGSLVRDIFTSSYLVAAQKDSALAKRMIVGLRRRKHYCLSRTDLDLGASGAEQTRMMIQQAHFVFVLLTRSFANDADAQCDLQQAWAMGRTIIPLLAGGTLPSALRDLVPATINTDADAFEDDLDTLYTKLAPLRKQTAPQQIVRVLFLGATPEDLAALELEYREIQEILDKDARFTFNHISDVMLDDLAGCFLRYRPHIVHFSGHADGDGNPMFRRRGNEKQAINPAALAKQARAGNPRSPLMLILNACMSFRQAEAIRNTVDALIVMSDRLQDSTARSFSRGFYYNLVQDGATLEDAFQGGLTMMAMSASQTVDVEPRLMMRESLDSRCIRFF
jgi:hypothetical protein